MLGDKVPVVTEDPSSKDLSIDQANAAEIESLKDSMLQTVAKLLLEAFPQIRDLGEKVRNLSSSQVIAYLNTGMNHSNRIEQVRAISDQILKGKWKEPVEEIVHIRV